jgi:hypothetical protein
MAEQQNNRAVRAQIASNREARRTAEAQAKASEAEAKAELARAQTEIIRAQAAAEQARLAAAAKAADDKRAAERAAADAARQTYERIYQSAAPVTALVTGLGVGAWKAHGIDKKHQAYLKVARPELTALGTQAQRLMRPGRGGQLSATTRTKLSALVRTADRIGLTKARGPIGVLAAGAFLAEGLVTRALATNLPSREGQEVANFIGMGLMSAGAGVLATRALQRASPKALPAAKPLAAIEAARQLANVAPAPVQATQRAMQRTTRAVQSAAAVRSGVLSAIGSQPLAAARRVAVRGGVLGAVAALGFAAAQTSTGQAVTQWVRGHMRTDANGRTAYVRPHERRVG